jgi:glyoxylase-like metal-dependent hydrolase (beta-lactamase superfamily II)/8-oxo-dGTP pyrophosphatase MutT (NUDIX family)
MAVGIQAHVLTSVTPESVAPLPAATVVVLREGPVGPEVLLTHRPATMAFAAGMHVFPGGRVDAGDPSGDLLSRSAIGSDDAAARLGGDAPPDAALAAHIGAIRELWEESGILLAETAASPAEIAASRAALVDGTAEFGVLAERLDLRLRTDRLQPLSRWVTPPGYPRRFDARFFAALLQDGAADPTIASGEVVALEWFRPSDALDAMADGRIGLWLPTSSTLQQLEHLVDPADLVRLAPGRLGDVAVDEPAPDVVRVVMPAGGGVAGQPVCAYLVGQRRFVLVDPGDPTGPALDRCLEFVSARGGAIAAIALTHADPDHHGGAEGLAERLGVPVLAGPGAASRLPYAIVEIGDGDVIHVGDVPLQVVGTPGPRPDHLCFLDAVGGVALIGDLDGRRGARMLPGPSDEDAWARSRSRMDALAPNVRLGGHPA